MTNLIEGVDDLLESSDKNFKKKCKPSKGLEATGHCYSQAANAQSMGPKGWLLVHGRPTLRRPPFVEYGHAWLEKGEMVHDPSTDARMPRLLYYMLGSIDHRSNLVYTAEEARQFMRLTEHFGPWEGPEGTPATSKQKKKWKEAGNKPPRRSTKSKALPDLTKEFERISAMSESDNSLTNTIRLLLRDENGWGALGLSTEVDISDGTPRGDKAAALEIAYTLGYENPSLPFGKARTMRDLSLVAKADRFLPKLKKSWKEGQADAAY
jgi:hypothetical protein